VHFGREYWVELLIVVLTGLAIFLLVEQMSIREQLADWLRHMVAGTTGLLSSVTGAVRAWVMSTTLSDLLGYVFILTAVVLLLWRHRQRLMRDPRRTTLLCPRCGSELHRIHRHSLDRILTLYVPVRRYQCKNDDCLWHGLRVKTSRYH
jgi:hypothetical protein